MNFSYLELKVPPVLAVAAAALLMWGIARLVPGLDLAAPGRTPAALLVVLSGAGVALAGVIEFRRARTTVNPLRPGGASSLVRSGVYRWTRNPMYLGFALALLGWGMFLSNPAALAGLFAFVAYMNRFQIAPEEKALQSLFGEDFASYCRSVRRWL